MSWKIEIYDKATDQLKAWRIEDVEWRAMLPRDQDDLYCKVVKISDDERAELLAQKAKKHNG